MLLRTAALSFCSKNTKKYYIIKEIWMSESDIENKVPVPNVTRYSK